MPRTRRKKTTKSGSLASAPGLVTRPSASKAIPLTTKKNGIRKP
jgi:hypothetical protein